MQIPVQSVIYLLVGIIFLTSGRRLFWLFVACVGFVIGFEYGGNLTGIKDQWSILIIALGTGIAGALLAIFLQSIAICVAGFLIGGFAVINLLELTGYLSHQYFLISFVVGGIIGLILMLGLFDYALIFLSSIAGAFMIVHTIYLMPPVKTIVFLILAMAGAVFQAKVHPRNYRRRR
jgi:hypothetical protein